MPDGTIVEGNIISIHALREEGDAGPTGGCTVRKDFNPRPPRGGRHPQGRTCNLPCRISIHALREEGDSMHHGVSAGAESISIHALREEGDRRFVSTLPSGCKFQSTPSARRATALKRADIRTILISIHALREEGDGPCSPSCSRTRKFQSTPSARRATSKPLQTD